MTIITLPLRSLHQNSHAKPLTEAALEWERTNDQLELLAEQIAALSFRRSTLAGAAAAHIVLLEHPTAASLIFSVRNGRAHVLWQVLDARGRILPANRTGSWAEDVLGTVQHEDLTQLGRVPGIHTSATGLQIEIGVVTAGAVAALKPHTAPVQHSLAQAA